MQSVVIRRVARRCIAYTRQCTASATTQQRLYSTGATAVKGVHVSAQYDKQWSPQQQPGSNSSSWSIASELRKRCHAIEVDPDNVEILESPQQFYSSLLDGVLTASRRISLASLYLGTGELECQLVDALQQRASDPDLALRVLLDHSRGTRLQDGASSATLLAPVVRAFGSRATVKFLKMPQLQDFIGRRLPPRWREGVAVQHLKAYVFDDTVLLTGANLSHDYFTNRQDRAIVFHNSPRLAEYFVDVIGAVQTCAHDLSADGELHSPGITSQAMAHKLHKSLHAITTPPPASVSSHSQTDSNSTLVFPSLQLAAAGLRQDQATTLHLLRSFAGSHDAHIACGYFNLPQQYKDVLLQENAAAYRAAGGTQSSVHILTASPRANGFHSASGIAGALPAAYSKIEELFVRHCAEVGLAGVVGMYEYERPAWTFHAKGLWLAPSSSSSSAPSSSTATATATAAPSAPPTITLVGSPNLGRRSVERDLEAQVVLYSGNEELQKRLGDERDRLWWWATPVHADDTVWQADDRLLHGWSWQTGTWIYLGYRLVAPYL